ncbi:hypothetical protein HQQ80_11810 [Microbacteriaceae bacterium VKM Ac-2855]|nr:hypothetical protein [Microbacteriaceae bacterium VKM Ac-2855]
MPSYMLTADAVVRLSDRPLTVRLQLQGGAHARLDAVVGSELLASAVRPRADLLIVPSVTERIVIRLTPVGTDRFPGGAVANVSVGIDDARSADPERAVVPPLDLAGLDQREILVLEPGQGGVLVHAVRRVDVGFPLDPVGEAARIAAVEILGTQSVAAMSALNVVTAVDASASFRRFLEDGKVGQPSTAETVASVLDGVSAVITAGERRGAAVVGAAARRFELPPGDAMPVALVAAMNSAPRSSGLRSGSAALTGFAPGNTMTFVVTDAVPADVAAFEAADEIEGEARHLAFVGTRAAWQLQRSPSTPHTVIEPDPAGRGLAAVLLSDPFLLRSLVRSFLVGCFAPGTDAFERVAR